MLVLSLLVGLFSGVVVFFITQHTPRLTRILIICTVTILTSIVSLILLVNILTDSPPPGSSEITFDEKDTCLENGNHWIEETQTCEILPLNNSH